MDDALPFLGTIGRHGQLALQGLRVATHALRGGGNPAALAEALGQLRGPAIKIAQFLATLPGILPAEYAAALATLQNNAPPMNPLFVKRRMASELGSDWQKHFAAFEMAPTFAASLGQVHRATLHNGQIVACKLQYPRMEHVIETDLEQLQWWLGLYKAWDGTIDHTDILKEIHSHLTQELDYSVEQKNMMDFNNHYSHLMIIPEVIAELSTGKLLTMTWLDGSKVWNTSSPEDTAEKLFRAWYTPFYQRGWLHSDPHPGNYLLHESGKLIVFDFGCVRHFEPSFVKGVKALYASLKDGTSPLPALALWGFRDVTPSLEQALILWADLLFEPLLDDRVRPLHYDPEDVRLRAEGVYKALQHAGGIRPPQEFVLMDRTALGLGGVLTRLKAELNWHQLFEEVLANVPTSMDNKASREDPHYANNEQTTQ